FFFQAEDGIRDFHVTGVQTCALPISRTCPDAPSLLRRLSPESVAAGACQLCRSASRPPRRKCMTSSIAAIVCSGESGSGGGAGRSEERRVGKEGRSRWWR